MSPFFVLGWEHSSRFGEERSPHVSEHCVQQMSRFLLLLQLLVSPWRKGWEAVLRWTVRVIMERSGHSFKDAVVWFHCYWMEEGKIGVVFVFTQCGLLTCRWARVTLGKSCLQTLAVSPAGEKSHHTRKPEICLYPTAGILLSSWALTKITEIFMLSLLRDSVAALNLLRGTSLYAHGHNFTQPKAMRLNYGETCFLNSCSQPSFAETLIRQTTNRKTFFFFFF